MAFRRIARYRVNTWKCRYLNKRGGNQHNHLQVCFAVFVSFGCTDYSKMRPTTITRVAGLNRLKAYARNGVGRRYLTMLNPPKFENEKMVSQQLIMKSTAALIPSSLITLKGHRKEHCSQRPFNNSRLNSQSPSPSRSMAPRYISEHFNFRHWFPSDILVKSD